MRNRNLRFAFSIVGTASLALSATAAYAGPVKMGDVVQVVNSNPSRSSSISLRLVPQDPTQTSVQQDPNAQNPSAQPAQTPRVQTEEIIEITEDPDCNCIDPVIPEAPPVGGGFPYYLLGLGAIPAVIPFVDGGGDDEVATPNPTATPVSTTTPIGNASPTPTATATPDTSPTPVVSPTPVDAELPEPITIVLFGTGLVGIGAAARRRLKKNADNNESEAGNSPE